MHGGKKDLSCSEGDLAFLTSLLGANLQSSSCSPCFVRNFANTVKQRSEPVLHCGLVRCLQRLSVSMCFCTSLFKALRHFQRGTQSVSIPHAESLLHADCDGEEVNCEISPSQRAGEGLCCTSWSIDTLQLSSGTSIAPVLSGPPCGSWEEEEEEEEHDATLHPKLRMPMSKEGTLLTTVEFQSLSHNTSLHMHLGSSVTLDCHFALAPNSSLSSLERRRQHRGSGSSLFQYQVGSTGPAAQPKIHVDVAELLGSGDVSLSLQGVSMADEGTYICLVSTLLHQAQHIIQLHVAGEEGKHLGATGRDVMTTLTCSIAGYYPLDVSVSWTQKTPEDEVEIPLTNVHFSSHLQTTVRAPATYSCHVSHVALAEPISVSFKMLSHFPRGGGAAGVAPVRSC
uniref:TAP binding protein like n=1 Tax=Aquila chrysaetos chrysaetos TaxID=223781 RepID=A0A663FHE0_AQUCH